MENDSSYVMDVMNCSQTKVAKMVAKMEQEGDESILTAPMVFTPALTPAALTKTCNNPLGGCDAIIIRMLNPRVLPSDDTSPFLYGYPQGMQTQVQSTERQRLQQIKVMQLQQQQHQEMYQQSVNQTQQLYQVQHNIQFTPTSTMVGMPPGIKERSKSDQAAKVNSEKNRRITPEPVNANSEKSSKEKINKRG